MAQNPKDKHVDAVLTNISIRHQQEEAIWPEVLAPVPVNKKSDVYYKFSDKERLRLTEKGGLRPPGAYTEEVSYRVETDDYSCKTYAFGAFVESSEQENADAPLDPYKDATEDLTDEWHRHAEKRCSDVVFNPDNYPAARKTVCSGTSQWSHADSDPITVLLTAHRNMVGPRDHRRLLINPDTELELLTHAKILSRLTGGAYPGNPANVTLEDVAKLARVEKIVIGYMEYDSTAKKSAITRTTMWGKHALLYYHNPKPGLKKISLGYMFLWKFFGGKQGFRVRKVPDELRGDGGHEIIVEGCGTEKLVSTDVCHFFQNVVA